MDELTPNEIGAGVLSLPIGISKLGNGFRLVKALFNFNIKNTKNYLWFEWTVFKKVKTKFWRDVMSMVFEPLKALKTIYQMKTGKNSYLSVFNSIEKLLKYNILSLVWMLAMKSWGQLKKEISHNQTLCLF